MTPRKLPTRYMTTNSTPRMISRMVVLALLSLLLGSALAFFWLLTVWEPLLVNMAPTHPMKHKYIAFIATTNGLDELKRLYSLPERPRAVKIAKSRRPTPKNRTT